MPPHYAISEAFIVIAALWCGIILIKRGQTLGAVGMFAFGLAASIGVYRFPSGQVQELAVLHRLAGQFGGLLGMALIATELLKSRKHGQSSKTLTAAALAGLAASIMTAILAPAIAVPLFLFWSLVAIMAAFTLPTGPLSKKFLFALAAALMLINVLLFRQSAFLTQHVSWHIFHTLIAVWIGLIYMILKVTPRAEEP